MTTSSPPHRASNDERDVWPDEVTVGILTALPHEMRAVASLLDDIDRYRHPEDPNQYRVGTMPSSEADRPHRVALMMMPRDGTQLAATCCANMMRTFPGIQSVIMAGIAGGIPRPSEPASHVRLGDVVVAVEGIVNYGSVRQEDGTTRLRGRQGAGLISNWLLQAVRELQVDEQGGNRQWERWLDPERSGQARNFPRPPGDTDVLHIRGQVINHPSKPNPGPPEGMPRVHYGVIGSADVLMVDEDFRDHLAAQFPDMRAVEMEGSGIAASTAAIDRTWFMVRGVADYCELTGKSDLWHPYASFAAAAYVRALLEATPLANVRPRRLMRRPPPLLGQADQEELDALLRQVPSDLDIRPAWQATVPDLQAPPPEVLNTPAQAYHQLALRNADASGLSPAILFIAHVSRAIWNLNAELSSRLWTWVTARTNAEGTTEALRSRLDAAPRVSIGAGPLLLIEIAVHGIDRESCQITPYLQEKVGPWRPRPVEVADVELGEVKLGEVEEAVSAIVAEAERAWGGENATGQAGIEFLLPAGLLNLPVQWFPGSPRLGQVQPICIRYPVVLRSLERMREEGIRREWANRWVRLDRRPFAGEVQWGMRYSPDTMTLEAWAAGLSGDDRYVVVVLSDPPSTTLGRQELFAALAAGVPVILWDQRRQHPADGETEALRRLIAEPGRLPAEMRALRVEAARMAAEVPDHYGRAVALLWDDPNRVVPAGRAGS